MNKRFKILLGIIVIVGITMFFIPTIVKNYAINNSKELLGRKIEIGKLKYNYFSSTIQVHDFKMYEQNEVDEFTTFDTLILDMEPYRLFFNEKVVEQFYISGLVVKTIMKDSTFNFDDLIAFHTSEEDSLTKKEDNLFKYEISNIELKEADFFFNNENVNKETHIEDFSCLIPFIGWNQEEKSSADLKFNFKRGGYFESALNINPATGDFDAHFTINQLYLDNFLNYIKPYAYVNSFEGVVNSQIDIVGNTYRAVESLVSGELEVQNFKMTDTLNQEFLSAKLVGTTIDKIDYSKNNYVFNSVNITDSYTLFQLDSVSNNFFNIFKFNEPVEPEIKVIQVDSVHNKPTQDAITYTIHNFSLNNGILDYTDNLTGDPFKYHLSHIEIESKDISSTSNWLDLNSTMLLNERGNLKAQLGINPNDFYNATLDISVEKFLLPDLNLYTNYYMGHSILEGDMYYYSKSKLVDGNITSENKLLVKNASLENVKGGLYDLPLKFAFFLLTDKNGDVNLELPVRGDVKSPDYDTRKIIWQTFKNVIGKTVASPVNFLVGLVGGDPKELEEIEFAYTDTIPTGKQLKQLDKLLELESKKPELQIELTYFADKELQRDALAKDYAGALFKQETNQDYLKKDKQFKKFVYKKTGSEGIPFNDAIKQLTNTVRFDSVVNLRNEKLVKTTIDYLKEQSFSTKIKVKTSDKEAPENVGAYPKYLISYGMTEEINNTAKTIEEEATIEQ
ncbi:DUF748 domain-containing protein [Cognatitamlana onchidii]|uniref:DUF748 domain-containing protein n=1 Tax=Cognatitamlana onchidii TaxID=2562860 RepID=UPI0010A660CE|nr:DUF748 domain-containing protein [Algibacter onchidii]